MQPSDQLELAPRRSRSRAITAAVVMLVAGVWLQATTRDDFGIRSAGPDVPVAISSGPRPQGTYSFPTIRVEPVGVFRYALMSVLGDDTVALDRNIAAINEQAAIAMVAAQRDAWLAATALTGGGPGASAGPPIDAGSVGGPSGGLAFALAYVDILAGGDLTGGMSVVATGTVSANGTVGPVGGVDLKAEGLGDGVEVFFVPAANEPYARAHARSDVEVVGVGTVTDVLRWLCGRSVLPACHVIGTASPS